MQRASAADAAIPTLQSPAAAAAELAASFVAAGVRPGPAPLLVHSSLSSLGAALPGGADTVIDALLLALGPGCTLVMPTLSYLFVTPEAPRNVFDVRSTPTNLGAIPGTFLRRAGAVRSLHPTHSCCALGPLADAITGEHGLDTTPVGAHSPFRKVRDLGGQVAFLGCGLRCNTSIHGVEELHAPNLPPYLLLDGTVTYIVTDSQGASRAVEHRRHDCSGTGQRYERVTPLLREGEYRRGVCRGGAELHVLDAAPMWAAALAALQHDPLCLVDRVAEGESHHLRECRVVGAGGGPPLYKYVIGPADG